MGRRLGARARPVRGPGTLSWPAAQVLGLHEWSCHWRVPYLHSDSFVRATTAPWTTRAFANRCVQL
jgi:hypothetical protein